MSGTLGSKKWDLSEGREHCEEYGRLLHAGMQE